LLIKCSFGQFERHSYLRALRLAQDEYNIMLGVNVRCVVQINTRQKVRSSLFRIGQD
jgi:hypothetical protein